MGILNVTPDSFSDGGMFLSPKKIADQVKQMLNHDVDIIDIGGESTRPFAQPVPLEEELSRVIPAIRTIREITDITISVDTTKAEVARQSLLAGANIINDISALQADPDMLEVIKSYSGPFIIMHMQGNPANMQLSPSYHNVVEDIKNFFHERLEFLQKNGINKERVIIDPGVGFGKTMEHNLTILSSIKEFKKLGYPVLIGHSRKSFMEQLLGLPVEERDCPSAVISALLYQQDVDIIRVHDTKLSKQALTLAARLLNP